MDPTLEKLDRVLMNDGWESLFPQTNLRKIPRYMSDHNLLLLCTKQEKIQKSKQFCFNTAWVRHAEFIPKIKTIWGEEVIARNAASNFGY
jgi:hypothetical protein